MYFINDNAAIKTPHTVTKTPAVQRRIPSALSHDSNIKVIVRVRPPAGPELTGYPGERCVAVDGPKLLFLMNPDKGGAAQQFTFDHVAGENATQEDLFEPAGRPIVENCLAGYSSTMFTYGQVRPTARLEVERPIPCLLGSDVDKADLRKSRVENADVEVDSRWGMIPRIFQLAFALMKQEAQQRTTDRLTFACTCSFLEIYNEHFYDLLNPKCTSLEVHEGPSGNVFVKSLSKHPFSCFAAVMALVQRGAKNRRVAGTNMNRESSRSHSFFTCNIESTRASAIAGLLSSTSLTSQALKASGATGERLKEATSINTSLSQLGKVIMALLESLKDEKRHVPYRNSKLTFLLKDSLGGNSKTTMVCPLEVYF
ncbi:hypothetical protein CLOP_g130 [Closterium sp. NIES-67]|nr:hypothetical protein CLOP_g130 [Closterium sp. NIES-67]